MPPVLNLKAAGVKTANISWRAEGVKRASRRVDTPIVPVQAQASPNLEVDPLTYSTTARLTTIHRISGQPRSATYQRIASVLRIRLCMRVTCIAVRLRFVTSHTEAAPIPPKRGVRRNSKGALKATETMHDQKARLVHL